MFWVPEIADGIHVLVTQNGGYLIAAIHAVVHVT